MNARTSPARMAARIACGKLVDGLDWAFLNEVMKAMAARYTHGGPEHDLFTSLAIWLTATGTADEIDALDWVIKDAAALMRRAENRTPWADEDKDHDLLP
ncbi:MAG: hypothetical protein IT555_21910 [Acetobacteraceae bacterium]|nr:hypothetical protein [Acetobacteraceae bacterium]